MFPVVNIRAADAGIVHRNKHIVVILKLWLGFVDVGHIMRFVQGKGEILIGALTQLVLVKDRG